MDDLFSQVHDKDVSDDRCDIDPEIKYDHCPSAVHTRVTTGTAGERTPTEARRKFDYDYR